MELAGRYEGMWAAVGLHPAHVSPSAYLDPHESAAGEGVEIFDRDTYKTMAADPKVVAIGECGLDYFRVTSEAVKEKQQEVFAAQITLAYEVQKPLMIHCRDAFPDLISILKSNALCLKPGVIHFFSGTAEEAKILLDMGFSFTFGGVITFVRDYDEVVKLIPPDRILSETDAPYVTPTPHRGKRNEPAFVVEVVKKFAELKGIPVDEMAAQIIENARRVFSIEF